MSNEYSRKKRQASNDNPLLAIPAETGKKIIVTMKSLNQAFDELATSYQEYKEKRETLIDGAADNDAETEPHNDNMDAEDPDNQRRAGNNNRRRNGGGNRRRYGGFERRRRHRGKNTEDL